MKSIFNAALLVCSIAYVLPVQAQGTSGYKVTKSYKIPSAGGWDYIAVHGGRLYVSHGTQVNVLDQKTGDSVGFIPGTTGVHGIAFDDALGKGYTSNGRLNNITVFDLKTNAILKQIPVGQNPDAIMFDNYSKKIITCNGRSSDLSVVDPVSEQVVTTIPVGGKPETAVSDGKGKIFVNIEDKNSISAVDIQTGKVLSTWSLAPAEGPTGLAIDIATNRLFAGCDKMLVVVDAGDGHIVDKVTIADGCDGVAFDNMLKYIFASCGEGKLSVVQELSATQFKLIDQVPTMRSARTVTLDEQTHQVFLPAAEMGKAEAGQRPPMIPGSFRVLVVEK